MTATYSLLSQESLSVPRVGPDLLDRLHDDHARIIHLIDQLLDINLQAVQQRIFEDIKGELRLHLAVYEQVFLPAFTDAISRSVPEFETGRPERAQAQIFDFLVQLTKEGMTSPKWMLVFGELKHAVEEYIEDQNRRVFPMARDVLPQSRLDVLSQQAEIVRQDFRQRHGISVDHVDKG